MVVIYFSDGSDVGNLCILVVDADAAVWSDVVA